jgi:bifunctional DNase/RNase
MEYEVKVRGLILDPTNNSPVVILKDVASEAILPIWIGVFEANAIAMEIEKGVPPRPMTHDLLKNVIAQLGASVERVVITDLRDSTFYAIIVLDVGGGESDCGFASKRCHCIGTSHRQSDLRGRACDAKFAWGDLSSRRGGGGGERGLVGRLGG